MSYGLLLCLMLRILRLFILQKKTVMIGIYDPRARISLPVFRDVDILTIASQYFYNNIMYIARISIVLI